MLVHLLPFVVNNDSVPTVILTPLSLQTFAALQSSTCSETLPFEDVRPWARYAQCTTTWKLLCVAHCHHSSTIFFLVGSRETVLKSVTESYRWASMDSSAQRNVTVGRPEDKRLRTKISRKAEALDTDVYVSLR